MNIKYPERKADSWDGRKIVHQAKREWCGFEFIHTIEDVSRQEQVIYRQKSHTVSVLLSGRFRTFELGVDSQQPVAFSPVEGDVYIIPAERTVTRQIRGGRIEYAELHFPKEAIANAIGENGRTGDLKLRLGVRDEFIHRSARKLSSLIAGRDALTERFGGSLFSALCFYLFMNYSNGSAAEREPDRSPISTITRKRLADYLEANIGTRITLSMMAEIAELPPRQFLQAFHRACGLTPIQHLIWLRIRHACELLATNSVEIVDIAMRTGFSSHAHFTRTFKERMGINPSEYRRRLAA